MKKLIIAISLLAICSVQTYAQELYKKVYENATNIVNDPKSSEEQIQINQFKVTVLNYINSMVQKKKLEKSTYFFDSQAVNMASFITDFQTNLMKARAISTAKRLEVINCYRDATLKYSLFNDTDKERVLCYVNDKQTYTPFSLDTDWEKAYKQASENVKKIFK